MPSLTNLLAQIPARNITRKQGIITGTPTALTLNVDGNTIPFRCIDPLIVGVGDTVAVDLVAGTTGQAEAWVIGRLSSGFRPGSGTVKTVPPSSPSITVTGTDGVDYTAYFISSYTPTVNDNVELSWAASLPYVLGKVGATAAPPPPPQPIPAPPPPVQSGQTYYAATDTGTWAAAYGQWDVWAGGGGHLYQGGSAYGSANTGSWFYGGSPMELAGRTITRIQFHTPGRLYVGSYNATVTAHFYTHTSSYKPATGDVNRDNGPDDVLIIPGWGGGWIDLPVSWGARLTLGGGIGIAGEPYLGFFGKNSQPDSGNLLIDWTR